MEILNPLRLNITQNQILIVSRLILYQLKYNILLILAYYLTDNLKQI
jgi:hypothetical protein